MILFLLFFVLGPFGLPILYQSPNFGKRSKILLTIVMIPYTWYLCVLTLKQFREASQKIAALQEQIK
ncbi:MAG: hypothetical protein A3G34_03840 [Candidatus Lindowbacteria bacterium RIFCSPLOWO2_12_FULL_62_27]|nr:MAG: hypothetical protein A3I06_11265 [Candidatus Lindowbacteria bacterium RIFCSPLOWO2_02_FULL_62_12]OGH59540.1 MAG: hypothetical protein A3G34_03840 [Candidatus Lindowbacteria bacterium RIFCSPLOWO2_12_FULL_62_27]